MRSISSVKYSATAFSFAMLLIRLVFAGYMLTHGFSKLSDFHGTVANMPHFLGLSKTVTACLVIFAEFFCSLFLIIGLFTRIVSVPIIFSMAYIFFVINQANFAESETAVLFLFGFFTLFLLGPGRFSVDNMINGK